MVPSMLKFGAAVAVMFWRCINLEMNEVMASVQLHVMTTCQGHIRLRLKWRFWGINNEKIVRMAQYQHLSNEAHWIY